MVLGFGLGLGLRLRPGTPNGNGNVTGIRSIKLEDWIAAEANECWRTCSLNNDGYDGYAGPIDARRGPFQANRDSRAAEY